MKPGESAMSTIIVNQANTLNHPRKLASVGGLASPKGTAMQMPPTQKQHVHNPNLSATILRESGSSSPGIITRLWYDGCEMTADEVFVVGEKINVVIRGMGSIRAQVTNTAEGTLSTHFVEEYPV